MYDIMQVSKKTTVGKLSFLQKLSISAPHSYKQKYLALNSHPQTCSFKHVSSYASYLFEKLDSST